MDSPWKIWTTTHRWKKCRRWTYFSWTSGLPRFLETAQVRKFSSTQCAVASFPAEHCVRSTRGILMDQNQVIQFPLWTPLIPLVVTSWPLICTDLPSCGWSRAGRKFSEGIQIFQKNSFRGEPILGRSKLNMQFPPIHLRIGPTSSISSTPISPKHIWLLPWYTYPRNETLVHQQAWEIA